SAIFRLFLILEILAFLTFKLKAKAFKKNKMHLGNFHLEVLVNGQALPEYNQSVMNQINFITYIPVMTPGERFTIRTEVKQASTSNIIISRLYIDGQFHEVHHLHQQHVSRTISYFVNFERDQVYYFKFASTSQLEKKDDDPEQLLLVFKGIIVDESALIKPKFEVKQVKVTYTADNGEIDYTTGYDVVDKNSTVYRNKNY
ncbi:13593_t:CDS:2, partial [Funneliformis mosseae]